MLLAVGGQQGKVRDQALIHRNIALLLAYNGSHFHGWQRQADQPSVQAALEAAFLRISGTTTPVTGCGRTDQGVHGIGYVANCYTTLQRPPEHIVRALNAILPAGITIRRAWDVPTSFHSRFNALSKTYRYVISNMESPFLDQFAATIRDPLDIENMRRGASYLIGTHDFSAFRAAGSSNRNPVRTISSIVIARRRFSLDDHVRLVTIEITADGFLYRMARNIAGSLIATGRGQCSPEDVHRILEGRDRTKAPAPAPACGLFLVRVRYGRHMAGRSR